MNILFLLISWHDKYFSALLGGNYSLLLLLWSHKLLLFEWYVMSIKKHLIDYFRFVTNKKATFEDKTDPTASLALLPLLLASLCCPFFITFWFFFSHVCRRSRTGNQCQWTKTQTLVWVPEKQRQESGVLAHADAARSPQQWQNRLDCTTDTHTYPHAHTRTHT